jgi:oxygen-independent coproporphyrinogen III oxidase
MSELFPIINQSDFFIPLRGGGYEIPNKKIRKFHDFLNSKMHQGYKQNIPILNIEQTEKKLGITNNRIRTKLVDVINAPEHHRDLYYSDINTNLYIHIPFCISRCIYCPFYIVHRYSEKLMNNYIHAITNEMDFWEKVITPHKLSCRSIYFGGGSPLTLGSQRIKQLCSACKQAFFTQTNPDEITIEINPGISYTSDDFTNLIVGIQSVFIDVPIRFSIGIQSMANEVLSACKRSTTSTLNMNCLKLVSSMIQTGMIYSANADIIIGLPQQTLRSIYRDIHSLIQLDIPCITIEQLQVYPNTRLGKNIDSFACMSDNAKIRAKETAFSILEKSGYIPNSTRLTWARNNHNRKYMSKTMSVIGLGASAFGRIGALDYTNIKNIHSYIKYADSTLVQNEISIISRSDFLLREMREAFCIEGDVNILTLSHYYNLKPDDLIYQKLNQLVLNNILTCLGSTYLLKDQNFLFETLKHFSPDCLTRCFEEFELSHGPTIEKSHELASV